MSEYTSTTTSATTRMGIRPVATSPVTPGTLLEAAFGGSLEFHKVRATGTTRRWPVLAPGSTERKAAERLAKAVAKGTTVTELATANHTSVATVRRSLTALAFTQEVEGLSKADRKAIAKEANSNGSVHAEVSAAKAAQREAKAAKAEAKAAKAPKGKKGKKPAKVEAKAAEQPVSTDAKRKAHAKRMKKEAAATVAAGKKAGAAKATA